MGPAQDAQDAHDARDARHAQETGPGAAPASARAATKAASPPVPNLVAELYSESPPSLRVRLLECLIRPVRPLGLVAVAAGAFGSFLHRESWGRMSVPIEDAMRFSTEQVLELARFVEQAQPEALRQVAQLLADNPACLTTLTGALLLMTLGLSTRDAPAGRDPAPATRPTGRMPDGDSR